MPAAPPAAVVTPRLLDIEGNLVLVDEVYLAALDLPATTEVTDPAAASDVERQLTSFLRRAGYALATVEAEAVERPHPGDIDEGRLSAHRDQRARRRVLAGRAIQVDLPYGVFNRPQLERMLQPSARTGRA